MKFPKKYFLLLIVLFFLASRLYKISEIPPSVYWDEASIGVNGYSILKTGQDEWGNFLPLHFKAFGEYKLPVFIYSAVPFIAIFGLNEFALRLPAVLFSLGVVFLSYLFAKKISNDIKIGLLTAFFVTTLQWFFLVSRVGYEANAGLFFFMAGIYWFLCGFDKSKFFIFAAASLVISLYSYNSFRIITPLTVIILLSLYFQNLRKNFKKDLIYLMCALIVILIGVAAVIRSISIGASARLEDIGISIAYNERKYQVINTIIPNYLAHFKLSFLLFKGDGIGRSQIPGFGQLNIINLALLILGILYIFKKKRKEYFLPLVLVLIAPIPASITRESPHALRVVSAVPFIALISSLGLYNLASFFKKSTHIYTAIIAFHLLSFILYYQDFTVNYSKKTANDWQYSYKIIFQDYQYEFDDFDNVVISDRYDQPYIFALFYLKYDPGEFRRKVVYNKTIRKETSLVGKLDKLIFTNVDYYNLPPGKSLIFSHPTDKITEIKERELILNPDGSTGAYVYEYEI